MDKLFAEIATKYGYGFAQFYLQITEKVHAKANEELEAKLPELLAVYQETKQKQQQNYRASITPPPSESGTTSGTESSFDDQPLEEYKLLDLDAHSKTITNGHQGYSRYQEQPIQSNEHRQQIFDETNFVQQFEYVAPNPTMINQHVSMGSSVPEWRSTSTSGFSTSENKPQLFGLQTVASTSTNVSSQAPSVPSSFKTPYIADYPEYDRPGPSTGTSNPIQQSIQPSAQQNVLSGDQDQVYKQKGNISSGTGFVCTFNNTCGKVFSNKSDLKRHWVTHFDARPYICKYDDCDKDFKDRNTAVNHIRAVHFNMAVRGPEKKQTKSQQVNATKYLHVDRDMLEQIWQRYMLQ